MIGQNGVGKTTLLNRLAAKDITGFPKQLKVWYIRHEVVCDDGVDVRSFMRQHASLDEAKLTETLTEVGFTEALQTTDVNNLSGGWKMKLSIAISILQQPELLLLDEPTNHLDRNAVAWLTRHLLSLRGVTILVVSHDYDFIEQIATDVAHYDNDGQAGKPCHLVYYPMGFAAFQELKPEIVAGLPTAANAMASAAAAALGPGARTAHAAT
jgi:elongation factor 3